MALHRRAESFEAEPPLHYEAKLRNEDDPQTNVHWLLGWQPLPHLKNIPDGV